MLTDRQGVGDDTISLLAAVWSWGASLTATPAGLSCLNSAVFADWAAGVVNSHTRRSANPPAAPPSVSDGGPALAGFTERQIEMNWTPGEESGQPWSGKWLWPCFKSLLWSERRVSDIHLPAESACDGGQRFMSTHRLCPWLWLMKLWPDWNEYILSSFSVKYSSGWVLTCRFQGTSQGGSTPSD